MMTRTTWPSITAEARTPRSVANSCQARRSRRALEGAIWVSKRVNGPARGSATVTNVGRRAVSVISESAEKVRTVEIGRMR
jgi:hypothetical protein